MKRSFGPFAKPMPAENGRPPRGYKRLTMSSGCCTHPTFHPSRRSLIKAGAIGLLGLGMNHVPALRALAAANPSGTPVPRAKSVIYIFLSGGLSQLDSFDMKPHGPIDIRGEFKPIRTKTPGIEICEHLPELAKRSDKWSLVRSLTHKYNDHSIGHHVMLTGRSELPPNFNPNAPQQTDFPSMASLAGALLEPRNNLPPAIVLPDRIMHTSGRLIPGQFGGQMGKQADPWFLEMSPFHPQHYGAYPEYLFHPDHGQMTDDRLTFQAPHLSLPQGLDMRRMLERVSLRDTLERQSRAYESAATSDPGFDKYREAAVSLLTNGKVHDAFSVEHADPALVDRYGRNSFGWSLLIARQLVEVGISLVQVNLGNDETWDTHTANFPDLKDMLLPPMDRAVSALIDDLDSRGMLKETLIVMGSEFGRTPKISTLPGARLPGRDHWGASQTVFLAGGGIRGGTVIGETDSTAAYPIKDPQRPENLAATIFNALGLPRQIDWHDLSGRPFPLYHADPIKGLM